MWLVATILNHADLPDVILGLSESSPFTVAIAFCESLDDTQGDKDPSYTESGVHGRVLWCSMPMGATLKWVFQAETTDLVYRLNSACSHVWLTQLKKKN